MGVFTRSPMAALTCLFPSAKQMTKTSGLSSSGYCLMMLDDEVSIRMSFTFSKITC